MAVVKLESYLTKNFLQKFANMYTLPNQPQSNWFVTNPNYRPRRWWVELLKFLGLFILFFALLVLVVMGPTYYSQLSYLWGKPTNNYSSKYDLPVAVDTNGSSVTGNVTTLFDQKTALFAIDSIVIPKINVDAPIIYLNTTDNATIIETVKDGVGHYYGTAMPGHNGNVFLTGHSSYYWWSGGKYNQVFANLNKLKSGDLIYIYYQSKKFVYQVNNTFVVEPSRVDVLSQTAEPTITLMTCTPVGTNLRRLIVQGTLINQPSIKGDFGEVSSIPKPPTILPLY